MFRKVALAYLLVLVGSTYAEIPSYIEVCGRRNPNFIECVKNSAFKLLPKLIGGIPELDVPPVEPLIISNFNIINLPSINATAQNVTVRGLLNVKVQDLIIDLEKQYIIVNLTYDRVVSEADYNIEAKILVPIVAKGSIQLVNPNMKVHEILKFNKIKKNGKEYIKFVSVSTNLDLQNLEVKIKSDQEIDNAIVTAISSIIGSNNSSVIENIKTYIEDAIGKKLLIILNNITKNFSYDELFPDRE